MSIEMALKALAIWALILVLAIANGTLREAVLMPNFGRMPSFLLSGFLLSSVIVLVAYFALSWIGARSDQELALVGLEWLSATLIFEFTFGLFRGKSLAEILEAYTFKDGNIWVLVLLVTALAPWVAGKLRGWS